MARTARFIPVLLLAVGLVWIGQQAWPGTLPEREGTPMGEKIVKTDEEWRRLLTDEQYRVTRRQGTERAFSGAYCNNKDAGTYECVCCGQPLFDSATKFDSGTGWPSFWQPITADNVSTKTDRGWFMVRTEVLCSRCNAHLGHVFNDGPAPTGLRYCMNSAALRFAGQDAAPAPTDSDSKK